MTDVAARPAETLDPVDETLTREVAVATEVQVRRRGRRREAAHRMGLGTIAIWGLVAFGLWVFTGLVTMDLLGSVHIRPLWWVAATAIPAGVLVALVHRAAADDASLARRVLLAAAVGGPLSIVLAATVNRILITDESSIWWVGLTEEGSKLLATVLLAWGLAKTPRAGLLLGVVVGLGFAVWESAGYFADEFAAESTWLDAASDIGGRMLTLGLHPFFAGLIACAAFAAINRPRVATVAVAVVSFASIALTHSGFDWALGAFDVEALGIDMGTWLPIVVTLALAACAIVAVRAMRGVPQRDGS